MLVWCTVAYHEKRNPDDNDVMMIYEDKWKEEFNYTEKYTYRNKCTKSAIPILQFLRMWSEKMNA